MQGFDGSVKLFDFDIARTYKKEASKNTTLFGYGQSETRTDIYSIGVTLHKMLTGKGFGEKLKKISSYSK